MGGVSHVSELEDEEAYEWPEERDLRETKRWKRSLIDILAVGGIDWEFVDMGVSY
jgi:hypothetical protein